MRDRSTYRVLMAAGGTGGHVYPAISIADAIKLAYPQASILFTGTRTNIEWNAVPRAGYQIEPLWISGFHRQLTARNLLFPLKLVVSLVQSFRIITNFKPHVVVCCGGYVAGPIGRMAALLGYPLYLQEQNSYPGVTNRILSRHAKRIFTAFEDAEEYFPKEKVWLTGNPVRKELKGSTRIDAAAKWRLNPEGKTIVIMGGSGGAKSINKAVLNAISVLHDDMRLQILWQCGRKYLADIEQHINVQDYPNLRLSAFFDHMADIYALADIVICRAGAGTISELLYLGKPAILVPSTMVAGDHQTKNALSAVRMGAATMVPDHELESRLVSEISALIIDPERLQTMSKNSLMNSRENAAESIAEHIIEQTLNHRIIDHSTKE